MSRCLSSGGGSLKKYFLNTHKNAKMMFRYLLNSFRVFSIVVVLFSSCTSSIDRKIINKIWVPQRIVWDTLYHTNSNKEYDIIYSTFTSFFLDDSNIYSINSVNEYYCDSVLLLYVENCKAAFGTYKYSENNIIIKYKFNYISQKINDTLQLENSNLLYKSAKYTSDNIDSESYNRIYKMINELKKSGSER